MLREITGIKQHDDEGFRRWFTAENMDLYVWSDEVGRISKYQLVSQNITSEHLIEWSNEEGLKFAKIINDYEGPLRYKAAPVINNSRSFSLKQIFDRFVIYSRRINNEISRFIINTLVKEEILLNKGNGR